MTVGELKIALATFDETKTVHVDAKEYKFLCPVIDVDTDTDGDVVLIIDDENE